MDSLFLIGNGYVASYIADMYKGSYKTIGVCRTIKQNCDENINIDIGNKNEKKLRSLLQPDSNIIYLAPPQQSLHQDIIIRNFIKEINTSYIKKFVYISTSGVYGDRNDGVVNEGDSIDPRTERAKRRADAENQIIKSKINYVILRVPGIYGKDRLPLKRIREKLPLIKESVCRHTNLIHVKDLANIIVNCISDLRVNNIIMNVSDGNPIKTTTYYKYIYDQLGLEYPAFIDMTEAKKIYDSKRMSFVNESRILDVSLMNELFPNIIRFRDLKDGIRDCLD